ncbi:bifunctional DNA primase/polymerase [Zavarzinella formosa]|uniref:bifunctional DNA primase/polymerase n=1 Tax=Zavarzinella formosa TaxID=360055 RepID=UPI0002E2EE54|nr:bifunctional DNA primase/polymerase [Zavarzinella formosa]
MKETTNNLHSKDFNKSQTLSQYARKYYENGWAPVAYEQGTKAPKTQGWQNLNFKNLGDDYLNDKFPEGFNNNVGLVLGVNSSGLVDVDCDCEEAVLVAEMFLPTTRMKHGRGGKTTHYWYRVTDQPGASKKFTLSGSLVELRSTGGQTMVPPSVHPNGERIEWHGDLNPKEISWAELSRAVATLASVCALTRFWRAGIRHDAALALSGGLMRAGWALEDIESFVHGVCIAADDGDVADRLGCVAATFRGGDGKTTGFPRLAELVGNEFVSRLLDWLGIGAEPIDYSRLSEVMAKPAQEKPKFTWSNFRELRRMSFKLDWFIEDLFPMGSMNIWAGESKIGKTTILMQLAEHTRRESTIWGKRVHKKPIYILDYEMGPFGSCHFANVLPFSEEVDEEIHYASKIDHEGYHGHVLPKTLSVEWLEEQFRGLPPSVLVVDSMRRAFGMADNAVEDWENKASYVNQLLTPLRDWVGKNGHCLIMIHHTNKMGKVSGSGDIVTATDNTYEFSRNKLTNVYAIEGRGRYVRQFYQTLRKQVIGGVEQLRFDLEYSERARKAEELRGYLLKTILFLTEKRTRTELLEHLDITLKQFQRIDPIGWLKQRGAVATTLGSSGGYELTPVLEGKPSAYVNLWLDQKMTV